MLELATRTNWILLFEKNISVVSQLGRQERSQKLISTAAKMIRRLVVFWMRHPQNSNDDTKSIFPSPKDFYCTVNCSVSTGGWGNLTFKLTLKDSKSSEILWLF